MAFAMMRRAGQSGSWIDPGSSWPPAEYFRHYGEKAVFFRFRNYLPMPNFPESLLFLSALLS